MSRRFLAYKKIMQTPCDSSNIADVSTRKYASTSFNKKILYRYFVICIFKDVLVIMSGEYSGLSKIINILKSNY